MTMTFDIRIVKVVGICLLTFFALSSLTIHFVLVEMVEDDNLLTNSNDWRHADAASVADEQGSYNNHLPFVGSSDRGGSSIISRWGRRLRRAVHALFYRSRSASLPAGGSLSSLSTRNNRGGMFSRRIRGQTNKMKSFRILFEQKYNPKDTVRTRKAVDAMRQPLPSTVSNMTYDIFGGCPDAPPKGYPKEWNLVKMLKAWNPDDTDVPPEIYQGLCVFDWDVDKAKAMAYRKAEVPFVLRNHPEVMKASERWNHPNYLQNLLGSTPQRNEYSRNNHFMFWRTKNLRSTPTGWKPPTENVKLNFKEWYAHAKELEALPNRSKYHVNKEHWYFRLNADYDLANQYVFDELPIFIPDVDHPTEFMVQPEQQRGINCRFGMRGVVAESHFDSSRNWIVLMGGMRRYILSHPSQCKNLELYPVSHPSGRHSSVNWSDPSSVKWSDPFASATANEVVLQAGDALYLPTGWFHFIVSLNINYQCNARSGHTFENDHHISECGLGSMFG